jgi:flagellar biosynthesis/type III secretory pathway protein FliH
MSAATTPHTNAPIIGTTNSDGKGRVLSVHEARTSVRPLLGPKEGLGAESGGGSGGHPSTTNAPLLEVPPDPRLVAAQVALEAAEEKVQSVSSELRQLQQAYQSDLAKARQSALDEAARSHVRNDEARVKALLETLRACQTMLDQTLAEFEQVAFLVAEAALAPIFSQAPFINARVAQAIGQQVEGLRGETVLAIRVRPDPGLDVERLSSSLRALGLASVEIITGPHTMLHEVQIDLKMGHIEIGIDDYWKAVQARLTALVDHGQT